MGWNPSGDDFITVGIITCFPFSATHGQLSVQELQVIGKNQTLTTTTLIFRKSLVFISQIK